MCGIFGLLSQNEQSFNLQQLSNPNHRGPDNTQSNMSIENMFFQFHRLSINDLNDSANQPFENDKYIWMCNGEIYNYKQLKRKYNIICQSNSDCEVIGHLIDILGIQSMSKALDGVFAISILDKSDKTLYLIRDPIGVRPLYYYNDKNTFVFASEGKSLQSIVEKPAQIVQFPPSSYMIYDYNNNSFHISKYFDVSNIDIDDNIKFGEIYLTINNMLVDSVRKRLISDRPIGCLLSGGLDSSLIASILSKFMKESGQTLKTFSVGFSDSEDLKYAKQVSKYLKTDHYELILDYNTAISRIPELIKHIETFDITTIRASLGMYLLSEYISKNHPEKVIFSGEGADELFGGYLYFHRAPSLKQFEHETKRLVSDLSYFDVLRSDRCTSAFGLELRVPFLDKDFMTYVLSISGQYRQYNYFEKYILRMAFQNNYLPKDILMRKKEAFSDGVGGMKKPFYKHIQDYILSLNLYNITDQDEIEKQYYKDTYYKHYIYNPIPYYWMPKWFNTNNPSARVILNST